MEANKKDLIAAAIFIVAGLSFAGNSWLWLKIGRAFRMGEGYFPIVLGLLLVALGLLVALKALRTPDEPWGLISWRGLGLITAAIVFFGLAVRHLGLAPALAGSTTIAGFATPETTVTTVIGLAVGLTAFCLVVFTYGLGLPLDLIGPWLRWG